VADGDWLTPGLYNATPNLARRVSASSFERSESVEPQMQETPQGNGGPASNGSFSWESFWRNVEQAGDDIFGCSFLQLCWFAKPPMPGGPGELADFVFRARVAFIAQLPSSRLFEYEPRPDRGEGIFRSPTLALEEQVVHVPKGTTLSLEAMVKLFCLGLAQFIRNAEKTLNDREEKRAPNRPGLRDGDMTGKPVQWWKRLPSRKRPPTDAEWSRIDASPIPAAMLRAAAEMAGPLRTLRDVDPRHLARVLPRTEGAARYSRTTRAFLVEYVYLTTGQPHCRLIANLLAPDRRALDRILARLLRVLGEDRLLQKMEEPGYGRAAGLPDCDSAKLAKQWRRFRNSRDGRELLRSIVKPR
jgi:hypothetical protein